MLLVFFRKTRYILMFWPAIVQFKVIFWKWIFLKVILLVLLTELGLYVE